MTEKGPFSLNPLPSSSLRGVTGKEGFLVTGDTVPNNPFPLRIGAALSLHFLQNITYLHNT